MHTCSLQMCFRWQKDPLRAGVLSWEGKVWRAWIRFLYGGWILANNVLWPKAFSLWLCDWPKKAWWTCRDRVGCWYAQMFPLISTSVWPQSLVHPCPAPAYASCLLVSPHYTEPCLILIGPESQETYTAVTTSMRFVRFSSRGHVLL